jgi:hypothetical protein
VYIIKNHPNINSQKKKTMYLYSSKALKVMLPSSFPPPSLFYSDFCFPSVAGVGENHCLSTAFNASSIAMTGSEITTTAFHSSQFNGRIENKLCRHTSSVPFSHHVAGGGEG